LFSAISSKQTCGGGMGMKAFFQGQWLGHPVHSALVHVPVALFPGAMVFDVLSRLGQGANAMVQTSFFAISVGLLVSVPAILSGLADWTEIKKEKPAWKIGLYHMILNLVVVVLFALNFGLRWHHYAEAEQVGGLPLVLSICGSVLLALSVWLGGLMPFDQGTAVGRRSKKRWRQVAVAGGARVPDEKNSA
jgi:uncharacterized membrane protein